ncbi:BPG_G0018130.mRNA.1.CDS.1 [Saccharomyces cerevisiae]|nr:CNB_1a_G0017580.mRNA.1.CDS.1 [Saccharomyces cerevisiae]CAI4463024.1 AEH_G0017940.mRNA.1.CDS.1 [Saccharomyces cerevisiae]CAI4880563.1 BPG_G0018130.mRNA.1.CDS.1 [Saccharomyces cerevisiae]CAI5278388.1 CNT_HP2_G0018900.mRNA.1.CDS.1 [Saccharomyces cerevisiae]CAI6535320.1 CNT_HP1_G0016250.mRNA.1.CDS.1 [Saccharomyces cerevisiae]
MPSSSIFTTKSASCFVSYYPELSTSNSLNEGSTVIPTQTTVEKSDVPVVRTSRHDIASAFRISDNQYFGKSSHITA